MAVLCPVASSNTHVHSHAETHIKVARVVSSGEGAVVQ